MRRKRSCELTAVPPAFPVTGSSFSRRGFLRLGGVGLIASFYGDVFSPSLLEAATVTSPLVRNTARNCIFIFLEGAPSHVDLWDFKEGSWTPKNLEPTNYGEVRWPRALLPKTADHVGKMAFIRSSLSWVAVHELGQVWAQIGRNPASSAGGSAPHIGAVVAIESYKTRKPEDLLPAFISFEQPRATSGYFSATYGPLILRTRGGGMTMLEHGDGIDRMTRRLDLLDRLDPNRRGTLGKDAADFGGFYSAARRLTSSADVAALFDVPPADHDRYGATMFGDSMVLAKQLIASNRGTRFVQTTSFGWDHHADLYRGLANRCGELDPAFSSLVSDLAATPGVEAGKTLLDETLIVIYSEFGRTTGALNAAAGRDHFPRMSVVMAGGGVRGGQIIGATDAVGDKVKEYGWKANRDVRPEDVTATMYSALGIDYTTIRRDDPLGRGFEYVPFARDGVYEPVDEVF